jgi:rhodanese-related sulfurtransferase
MGDSDARVQSGSGACVAPADGVAADLRFISPEEARKLLGQDAVAFVDCRSKDEFEAGHVAGSTHVEPGVATIEPAILQIARSAHTVVTYCDADSECERSQRIASLFTQAGAADVRVLEGGLPAWLAEGFPAQSGECRECGEDP